MDHFHIVTRPVLSDPVAARFTVDLCGGLLEDFLDVGPSGRAASGHQRGSVARTFFTSRDTRADKEEALGFKLLCTTDGIGEMGVATVNDDITPFEMGDQRIDKIVDGTSSLDQKDDPARFLEFRA